MRTPIYDFLLSYAESKTIRFHMPGHKGSIRTELNLSSLIPAGSNFPGLDGAESNLGNLIPQGSSFPGLDDTVLNQSSSIPAEPSSSGFDATAMNQTSSDAVRSNFPGENHAPSEPWKISEKCDPTENFGAKHIPGGGIYLDDRKVNRIYNRGLFGIERLDITEIKGADSLYEADGIIAESEANAAELFGTAATFYSTEGSSQCIRAMLSLAVGSSTNRLILAARNVHKAFVYAAGLIGFDVEWLAPETSISLCDCEISAELVEKKLSEMPILPAAVYLTSPNYLGRIIDVKSIARVCHEHGVLLLIDNAHGAYLNFLSESAHPISLGADACCDSAHKTLPALTGSAYLHLGKGLAHQAENAKAALELFGSTSPSYLILASLDLCNKYLAESFRAELAECVERIESAKRKLAQNSWEVEESDPLRIVLRAPDQMTGEGLAELLRSGSIECEYADSSYVVLMLTPFNSQAELDRLIAVLGENSAGYSPAERLPIVIPERVMTIREAIFSPHERIPTERSLGRISASPTISCPPAIPIVVSGEVISREAIELLRRYSVDTVDVLI